MNQSCFYEYQTAKYWENPQYKLIRVIKNNIYLAECQAKKIDVAIKMLKKSNKKDEKYEQREKEIISIIIELSKQQTLNPYVVEFYEIFQEKENTYIVMEYCDGDLKSEFENINQKTDLPGKEKKTLEILKQIIKGYNYLLEKFSSKFYHRDLKPENILHKKQIYKIADFGLSKFVKDFDNPTKNIGTFFYIAPEVTKGLNYTNTCDIYSLGALVYWLLTQNDGPIIDLQKIENEFFRGLVRQMIENEPQKRITWTELLKHDIMNLESKEVLNENYVNSRCFSTIIPAFPYAIKNVEDSFINSMAQNKDKSLEKFCKLNRIFIHVFKELNDFDIEVKRLLFTLWTKLLDQEVVKIQNKKYLLEKQIKQNKNNSEKIHKLNDEIAEYNKQIEEIRLMIERISVQQLIRIKQISDHTIEFMEIEEICKELQKKSIKNEEFQQFLITPKIL